MEEHNPDAEFNMEEYNPNTDYIDFLEYKILEEDPDEEVGFGGHLQKATIREVLESVPKKLDDPFTEYMANIFKDRLDEQCTSVEKYTWRHVIDDMRKGNFWGVHYYTFQYAFHTDLTDFEEFKKNR